MTPGFVTHADAAAAINLVNGAIYLVGGQTTVNDAGQGVFVFIASADGVGSVDLIVILSGGRLKRVTAATGTLATDLATKIGDNIRGGAALNVVATNLGKAVDTVPGATDSGAPIIAIRRNAITDSLAVADGRYATPYLTNKGALWVSPKMSFASGGEPYTLISAATTNLTSVLNSARCLSLIHAVNTSDTDWAYLKLYNKATAPVLASDTPVQVYPLAPNGGINIAPPAGMIFTTGVALAITGAAAYADVTAVAAAQVIVDLAYN